MPRIIIKKCYTWYNVYVNGVMVLKHISESEARDLIRADIHHQIIIK